MNIIISGVGKIGLAVISTLVKEGHDVTVIDKDPDIITDVTNISLYKSTISQYVFAVSSNTCKSTRASINLL